MFEQMLLPSGGTHQARNAALTFLLEAALVAVAVLVIPLLYVAHIPEAEIATTLIAPPPPPPPPPPSAAPAKSPSSIVRIAPRVFNLQPLVAPKAIPREIPMIADNPPAIPDFPGAGQIGGVPGGVPGGIPGGVLGGVSGAFTPPPPKVEAQNPPPQMPESQSQIQVGGEVEAARLSHQVVPAYPLIAKQAHIAGTVALSATIAPDGTVKDLHVLSGNPLLIDAAVNAVKQWTYRPTYLNGKPVEVLTEVDVRFTLRDNGLAP